MASVAAAATKNRWHGRHFQIVGGAMFRTFRCLWMLEELGLPYQHVFAMPMGSKIRGVNPLGKVPALVETSGSNKKFVMYESAAINTYLGDLVHAQEPDGTANPLVPPPGTHLRGTYEQTVHCIMNELDAQGLWIHRKHEALGQYFGTIPEAVQHAKQQFDRVNAVLVEQLTSHEPLDDDDNHASDDSHYLVGSQFTAADILYVHCLNWATTIHWDDQWKNNVALKSYLRRCKSRPAYQRAMAIRKAEQEEKQQELSKL